MIETDRTMLTQLQIAARRAIALDLVTDAAFVANALEAGWFIDHFCRTVMFQFRSYVLADQLVNETRTTDLWVPATWWQHFKQDHAPKRFLRRWPVRLTAYSQEVSFRQYRTYPDAKIALPPDRFGRPVIVEQFSPGWWERNDQPRQAA